MHESGDRIIAQAESSSGRIKVLEDRVRIERNAYIPGQTSGDDEFANGRIDNAWLQEPKMFGEGRIVISADAGAVRSRLSFGREEAEAFRTVARVIRERVAPREPAAVPGETERQAQVPQASVKLGRRARKLAERNMNSDESVEFVVGGMQGQTVVALQERLLVIKPGWEAGAAFGGRVTSFHYRDILGIEVNTGMVTGVVEINTAAHEGTVEKDYWSIRNKNADPYRVSNAIPVDKGILKRQRAEVEMLRRKVADAKAAATRVTVTSPAPAPQANSFVSELERLASLRSSGVLTEEEFQQAKRKLLG